MGTFGAAELAGSYRRRAFGLLVIATLLVVAVAFSLALGANQLTFAQVWHGLWHRDGSVESAIVWDLRVPRTAVAIATGAAFGVAGALIQALTRNPLADPGILGVNAGAGFAVTIGFWMLGALTIGGYLWFAFAGAAAATVLVYAIGTLGGRSSASPAVLVLAGVALAAVLSGIAQFLALLDPYAFQRLRFWGLGSVTRSGLDELWPVAPFLAAGVGLALFLAADLNSISLGDDLAVALGSNIARTRLLGIVAVTMLAGGATALTGGIAFVGLMTPHVVRWFTGPDQRWILAFSALAAPIMVLAGDVIGRVLGRPGEIEAGLMVAMIGAPTLIVLVRRSQVSGL
ncbi:MAG: iron chelate uptake ABC transporter family permease subunit [Thermomicrobiales bacterium]